jgi:hypothetical protein
MNENLGGQFNCKDCGQPVFDESGYTPHDHSNEPDTDKGFTITLSPESLQWYKDLHSAFALQAEGDSAERHREVDLSNRADLLDHLNSDNGHIMGGFGQYRASYNDDLGEKNIPGVRDSENDDFELTDAELRAIHSALHVHYADQPYENYGNMHRHL